MVKKIGSVIKEIRIQKGLTSEELSLEACISPSQLYYLENGKRNAGIRTYTLVLNALGLNLAQMLEEKLDESNPALPVADQATPPQRENSPLQREY